MTKSVSVINFSMWVSHSHPFSDTPSEWQFLDPGSVWYVVPPLFTENLMFSWLPQKKIEEQAMSIVCHFTKQRIKRIKDSWRANFQRCQTWDWIINNNWITTRTEAKFTLDYFFFWTFLLICVWESVEGGPIKHLQHSLLRANARSQGARIPIQATGCWEQEPPAWALTCHRWNRKSWKLHQALHRGICRCLHRWLHLVPSTSPI